MSANTGEIEFSIRAKGLTGGLARLTIGGGVGSSLAMLDNNELLSLLHTLRRTEYAETATGQHGFIYTFPIVFGE